MTARSNASKLLKRPDVREYIQKKQAEIHDKNTADIKEIEEYLTSVVRGKSKSEVLKLNGDGYQVVVEKHPEEKDRIRAAELLGKRYGMFKDGLAIDGDMTLNIKVDYGSDD